MKKILLSLSMIAVVGVVVLGATGAFYGDTETSTGNTFTAGAIHLKVDSTSHYNGMICTETSPGNFEWMYEANTPQSPEHFPQPGDECDRTWAETDLEGGVHTFFNFLDLKPGDEGEDTISLHVYNNDAWGQLVLDGIVDTDNDCTEPEQDMEGVGICGTDADGGEIDNYLAFTGWLDQGSTPGFQCGNLEISVCEDVTEGDNIWQDHEGPKFWDGETINDIGPFELSDVLGAAYEFFNCEDVDGNTDYESCHGFAEDGRMVESTTYYFGLAWELPLDETGNDAQTDSYSADMTFMVEQHRNNPNPFE